MCSATPNLRDAGTDMAYQHRPFIPSSEHGHISDAAEALTQALGHTA